MSESEEISKALGEQPKQRGVAPSSTGTRSTIAFGVLAVVSVVAIGAASLSIWSGLDQRDRLTEDVTKLENEIGNLGQELDTIEDEFKSITKKREELDLLNRNIRKSEQTTEVQNKKLNDLVKLIASSDAELSGIQQRVTDTTGRQSELKRYTEELALDRDDLTREINQLRDKVKIAQLDARQYEGRIGPEQEEFNTLQSDVLILKKESNALQASVDKGNQNYRELSELIASSKAELSGLQKKFTDTTDRQSELKRYTDELARNRDKLTREINQLRDRVKIAQLNARQFEERIGVKQEKFNALQSDVLNLEKERNLLLASVDKKRLEYRDLSGRISEMAGQASIGRDEIRTIGSDILSLKKQRDNASNNLINAQADLKAAIVDMSTAQTTLEGLLKKQETAHAKTQRLTQLKDQENDLDIIISIKQKEIIDALDQITQLKKSLGQFKNELESLQDDFQLAKLKSSELDRLTADVIIVNERAEKAQKELAEIKSNLNQLESEAHARKAEVARVKQEINSLQTLTAQFNLTIEQLHTAEQELIDVNVLIKERKVFLETIIQ